MKADHLQAKLQSHMIWRWLKMLRMVKYDYDDYNIVFSVFWFPLILPIQTKEIIMYDTIMQDHTNIGGGGGKRLPPKMSQAVPIS